jgi:hypothetical protein
MENAQYEQDVNDFLEGVDIMVEQSIVKLIPAMDDLENQLNSIDKNSSYSPNNSPDSLNSFDEQSR